MSRPSRLAASRRVAVQTYVHPDVAAALTRAAEREEIGVSALVRRAIATAVSPVSPPTSGAEVTQR